MPQVERAPRGRRGVAEPPSSRGAVGASGPPAPRGYMGSGRGRPARGSRGPGGGRVGGGCPDGSPYPGAGPPVVVRGLSALPEPPPILPRCRARSSGAPGPCGTAFGCENAKIRFQTARTAGSALGAGLAAGSRCSQAGRVRSSAQHCLATTEASLR